MAYTKSKKNIDADNDYLSKKSAVENYGTLGDHISDRTHQLQQGLDAAANAVKNYGDFNASDLLTQKGQQKLDAENAVTNYGSFDYALQKMYDDVISKRANREDFSYDVNGDALYQQYKDQYVNQGKMAMMDAMGQAAAMTGGYGNSFAQSVGQQAYQGHLQQLTDKIPELYSLALSKYQMEGQELDSLYAMLANDRSTQYGEWSDAYNRLAANRDYTASDYYNLYGNEYNAYTDKYNRLGDAYTIASDMFNTAWDQDYKGFETGLSQAIDLREAAGKYADTVYSQEYGAYTDKQAQDLALAQLAENKRQFDENLKYDATGSAKLSNGTVVKKVATAAESNPKIPDYVMDKVKSFSTNDELDSYLASMESQGVISQTQGDSLYETYKSNSLTANNWELKHDGGINWFGGNDNNAVVSYGGKDYTIKNLYNALIGEGMSKSEANDYIKKLQKKLGI